MKPLLLAIFALLATLPASAQFGNLLGKAAERAAQRKAEQAVEKKVEESIDKALDPKNSTKAKTEKEKMTIETDEAEVTIEEDRDGATNVAPSKFIGSYTTTMTETEKGVQKEQPVVMNHYIDAYQTATEMFTNDEKIYLIFDRRDRTTTTLTNDKGEKTGIKIKMPKATIKTKNTNSKTDTGNNKPIRTNETKTIEGHTCVKYTFTDEKQNNEMWIAEDIDIDPENLTGIFSINKKNADLGAYNASKGMVLEMVMRSKDPKKQETMTMRISNLQIGSVDKSKFSTEGYIIEDMSQMPFFGGGK